MILNASNSTLGTINITTNQLLEPSPLINNILIALLIVFLGLVLGKVAGRIIRRLFIDFQVDTAVKEKINARVSLQKIFSGIVEYTTYIAFSVWALNIIGITSLLLNIIEIVLAILIISTIVFSLRDALPNIVARRTITRKKLVKEGDYVEFKTTKGVIKNINASEVIIEENNGDLIHIPNILFIKEPFIQRKRRSSEKSHKLTKFSSRKVKRD
jgi:hypothetical protein